MTMHLQLQMSTDHFRPIEGATIHLEIVKRNMK